MHNLKSKRSLSQNSRYKTLKETINSCFPQLTDTVNDSIDDCILPENLGMANITPIIKKTNDKGGSLMKENYGPISILTTISKLFKRIIAGQISKFMSNKLSNSLCGLQKRYNTSKSYVYD